MSPVRTNLALTAEYTEALSDNRVTAEIIPLRVKKVDDVELSATSRRQLSAQKAMLEEMIAKGDVILVKPHKSDPDQRPYYHQSFLAYKRSLGLL